MVGSGILGQFEEKFKALIRDIKDKVCPSPLKASGMICFINEVCKWFHQTIFVYMVLIFADTLFNLGKTEGSIDGGQMIKPALLWGVNSLLVLPLICYTWSYSRDNTNKIYT